MAKKVTNVYVDNRSFLELLIDYYDAVEKAELANTIKPRIPEEIGDIIIKIATNMARRPNFNGYQFKDDMIGDAILNAVQAIKSFDPKKGVNPFAYFSQVVYWCFLRKISSEKTEYNNKVKMMFDSVTYEDDGDHFINKDDTFLWYHQSNE
jgi:hypothetical protein